jgi:hypothetical protein
MAYGPSSLTSASFRMTTHTDVFCLLPPSLHTHGFQIVLNTVWTPLFWSSCFSPPNQLIRLIHNPMMCFREQCNELSDLIRGQFVTREIDPCNYFQFLRKQRRCVCVCVCFTRWKHKYFMHPSHYSLVIKTAYHKVHYQLSKHSAFVANIFITVELSVSYSESRHCASIAQMTPAVYTNAVTFHITA